MKDILNHLLKCNLFRNIPLYERKIRIGIFSKFEVLSLFIFGRKKTVSALILFVRVRH